jgi:hypothetical protein
MRYEDLPTGLDRLTVATAVREIAREMSKFMSLKQIADHISSTRPNGDIVTENSVKMFLNRPPKQRVNRKNNVVPGLYDYIHANIDNFPEGPREASMIILAKLDFNLGSLPTVRDTEEPVRYAVGKQLLQWMHVESDTVKKLSEKISGTFLLFRKSSEDDNVILKSTVSFKPSTEHNVVYVFHVLIDITDGEKLSSGVAIPVLDNVYCFLESGERTSIELIVFHQPAYTRVLNKVFGIITTADSRRAPLSSKIVMVRHSPAWNDIDNRIETEDYLPKNGLVIREVKPFLDAGPASKRALKAFS